MPGLRDLKNRIKSVKSTRKITKAMQMVSAAKMRKAQQAVTSSRTYASLAWELIEKLSKDIPLDHPMLKPNPNAEKIGVVVLGSNRGLVGSLNSNLAPKLKEVNGEVLSEVVVYGKKARAVAQRLQKNIVADFQKPEKFTASADIYPMAKYISDAYATGQYKKIVIVYNYFVSTLVQKPTVKQLLPFTDQPQAEEAWAETEPETPFEDMVPDSEEAERFVQKETDRFIEDTFSDHLYEPGPREVMVHLLPRIVESQIYQTVLESDASEHSARMVMMKNATEAAGDLISDYTLTFNQLRQNKITTELAEITAGKIALE